MRRVLEEVRNSASLSQGLKAMSDPMELVAMGMRLGYTFGAIDIPAASASLSERPAAGTGSSLAHTPGIECERSVFYHYELDLDAFPHFGEVRDALARLRITPSSVDLARFRETFRRDDFDWTSMSPDSPAFSAAYEDVMSYHWQDQPEGGDFDRRDFHLVNLDKHTRHRDYESYFATKVQMVSALERLFGGGVQVSGSLWYPPTAYRLWHTNETQPGWRMYLVDLDGNGDHDGMSFFRYMNPDTKEVVTLEDRPRMMRLFKIEQERDKRFWHCIVNGTNRNRWSFGYAVPDDWQVRLADAGVVMASGSGEAGRLMEFNRTRSARGGNRMPSDRRTET